MPIDPAKPFDLHFVVDPNWAELRLDQYVKAMIPAMSRTKIQRYVREGRALVNDEPRPANWRVRLGDAVLLRCNVPEEGDDAGKRIPLEIIYEDDDILAVNKQPGLVVHPVSLHRHDTLLNALYWRYKDLLPPEQEVSLANRLDRNTSGVILVSKHTESKRRLQVQFEAREPRKTYLALVEGDGVSPAGEIDLPLGPAAGRNDRCKIGVRRDEAGKPSRTSYVTLERYDGYALVELRPHTGRQHQLRVHMAEIGYPLVCDDRYGSPESLAAVSPRGEERIIARYALHACRLEFAHPRTGVALDLLAPPAADMAGVLEALRAGWSTERR